MAGVGKVLRRADPSTIQDKFMVGYQGWFTCAGDGPPLHVGHHGWLHWFNKPIPDGGKPNPDIWPDVSDYGPDELYPAPGLYFENGEQAQLWSSRHPKTVQRHFNYMAQHGVDGAFLQRFAGQTDSQQPINQKFEGRNQRDEVGDRVREAAEKEGRVFAIMYDLSGVKPENLQRVLEEDWVHLLRDKHILDSPSYLKEKGKPVISLWGTAFEKNHHTPELLRSVVAFFRSSTPGGAYVIAGAPTNWRTLEGDMDPNPELLDVLLTEFDMISPWTVGRYKTEDDADGFAERKMKPDIELLKKRADEGHKKIDYMPVVLPGFSAHNLSDERYEFNSHKRNGGKFLWKQIHNARRLGVRVMYGAMWDEYDEGTALMPVVQTKRQVPIHEKFHFMALDEDGYDLPTDWYMRICGFAAEGLRSERRIMETFPSKELQDYWGSRPHYEEETGQSGSAGGSGAYEGQAYQEWLKTQKEDKDEPPPPPYSLEAMEEEAAAAAAAVAVAPAQDSAPEPAIVPPNRIPSPVQLETVVPQEPAVATTPLPQQPPPPVNPSSRPITTASSIPAPGPVDALTESLNQQASISSRPPVHPSRVSSQSSIQQTSTPGPLGSPSLTTGFGPPLSPAGSFSSPGSQNPYGGPNPPLQSPQATMQQGPMPHPFLPQHQQSFGPVSSSPPPLPQPQHQNSYGPQPGLPQPQHQYSYGPQPVVPEGQWPPTNWNSSPQPPHLMSQNSYPPPGSPGFSPNLSGGLYPTSQATSPPGPQSHPSMPPRPSGSSQGPLAFPQHRPPGGFVWEHHPQQHQPNFQHQPNAGPSFPIASNVLDFALDAVGSVAGDERRKRLEEGVGKLTQTGSKLYQRFTK